MYSELTRSVHYLLVRLTRNIFNMIRFYLGCTLLIFPAVVFARGSGLFLAFRGVPWAIIVYVLSLCVFFSSAKIATAEKTTRVNFWGFAVVGLPTWIVIYVVLSVFILDSVPNFIMGLRSEILFSILDALLFPIILYGFYKLKYRSQKAKDAPMVDSEALASERRLLFLWLGASWLAFVIPDLALISAFGGNYYEKVGTLPYGLIAGFSMGVCQWFAIRTQIRKAPLWIIACIAGWVVGEYTYQSIWEHYSNHEPHFLSAASLGALIGLAQWLVLYRQVRKSGLWIIMSAAGWGIGYWASSVMVGPFFVGESWHIEQAFYSGTMAGVVAGVVTGVTLVWLLRQRVTGT